MRDSLTALVAAVTAASTDAEKGAALFAGLHDVIIKEISVSTPLSVNQTVKAGQLLDEYAVTATAEAFVTAIFGGG